MGRCVGNQYDDRREQVAEVFSVSLVLRPYVAVVREFELPLCHKYARYGVV